MHAAGSESSASNLQQQARRKGGLASLDGRGPEPPEGLLAAHSRVPLKGPVSGAVSAALSHSTARGRGNASADALALRGLFDRRQLTVPGARKWLLVDEHGDASVIEVRRTS